MYNTSIHIIRQFHQTLNYLIMDLRLFSDDSVVLSRPFPRISIVRCKFLRIIMVPHADRRFVIVLPVCLSAYSTLCIPFYNQMPSASPALSRISLCFFLLKPPSTRLYDLSSKSFNRSSSILPFGLTEFQCCLFI